MLYGRNRDLASRRFLLGRLAAVVPLGILIARPAFACVLEIPFDFSRGAIGINAAIKGSPLFFLLDTGVDPSIIDRARAESLGLNINLHEGGEPSGYGDAKSSIVFPTTIDGLTIGERSFGPVAALVADMGAMSQGLGREIDGVLGYSFLSREIVLIDYDSKKIGILGKTADANAIARNCLRHWATPMQFLDGDNTLNKWFFFGDCSS
jgi:hypothetical protein